MEVHLQVQEQFKKVGNIIRSDESRKYVVPSAPESDLMKTQKLQICCTNVMQRQRLESLFDGHLKGD